MKGPEVAVVVPSLAGGGAERTAVTLVGYLAERGASVDLVLFTAEGPYLREVPGPVGVVDLGAPRARRALPGLVRYLRRRRPEALLAVLDRTIVLLLVAAFLARVPTRIVGRVGSTMSLASAGSDRWQDRLRPSLARILYGRCDEIVAISHGVARDLVERIGLPGSHIRVVHNPVDVDGLARRADGDAGHRWFGSGGPPVVLGMGRLTRQKDFSTLIRAFAKVRRRRPARLVILGEGEERGPLKDLARAEGVEDDVDLPGFVEDPAPYLGRAGVFVLSSAWEGFGNVIVEALAVGTPVVATDCESGPREILADGRHGRLVEVGNAEAMADAIVVVLEEGARPDALRARARDFAPEVVLPGYLQALGLGP